MSNESQKTQIIIAVIGLLGVIGAAIIGNYDRLFPGGDDTPVLPDAPSLILVPDLNELDIDAAEKMLLAEGLKVGTIEKKEKWAIDSYVVSQSPSADVKLEKGSKVDLVIAQSEFNFRVEHEFKSKDESLLATIDYQVKKIRPNDAIKEMGEFVITRVDLAPTDSNIKKLLNKLKSKTGYVQINPSGDYKLETSWDAFADLKRELGKKMAINQIAGKEKGSGLAGLTDAVLMTLIELELGFDIRAIFNESPEIRKMGEKPVELQIGNKFKSFISVEGPPALSAAGTEHQYSVVRRTPKATKYIKVGTASYSVSDGLLSKLNIMFHIGDKREIFYAMNISRI